MNGEATFVDTNVLVYAYDADAGEKHDTARARLESLWEDESGCISSQVLQEFYVTVTRKLSKPLRRQAARDVVAAYAAWPMHRPNVDDIVSASELEESHELSFWDALIVVSALRSGARQLLTEDLQDGQHLDGLLVVNPFRSPDSGEHSTGLE